jgi:hypothetical protein
MALHLEYRESGSWVAPAAADALHLISRQHQTLASHTLQPVSAFSDASGLGLGLVRVDHDMSALFVPGCCVLMLALTRLLPSCPRFPWRSHVYP